MLVIVYCLGLWNVFIIVLNTSHGCDVAFVLLHCNLHLNHQILSLHFTMLLTCMYVIKLHTLNVSIRWLVPRPSTVIGSMIPDNMDFLIYLPSSELMLYWYSSSLIIAFTNVFIITVLNSALAAH